MFLLRSAFWLTTAFIVIAPSGVDLGETVSDFRDQAIHASAQVAGQMVTAEPNDVARLPTTYILSVQPSIVLTKQVSPISSAVVPRPRPALMG